MYRSTDIDRSVSSPILYSFEVLVLFLETNGS